jgi:DNA-binding SARP family transcriptional activator
MAVADAWARQPWAGAQPPAGPRSSSFSSSEPLPSRHPLPAATSELVLELPGQPEVQPPVAVRVLAGFSLVVGGRAVDVAAVRPRARSTLRLLAVHCGDLVHREVLVGALWPDTEPGAALRSLQVAVSSLRTALDAAARGYASLIARVGPSYGLVLPVGGYSDLRDVETRLGQARAARVRGDMEALREACAAALAAYAGDLLPEEGFAEWVVPERHRLRLAAAGAAESLARCQQTDGDVPAAIETIWRCLHLDPYRDSAWRLLVDLHDQSGDRAAAQAARLRHRSVLAELGLPGGP